MSSLCFLVFACITAGASLLVSAAQREIFWKGFAAALSLLAVHSSLKNQETIIHHLKLLTQEPGTAPQPYAVSIPVRRHNRYRRNSVIRRIHRSGFVSSSSCTVNFYSVAVDDVRKEWAIVPPDGKDAGVFPFSAYNGYEIIRRSEPEIFRSSAFLALELRVVGSSPRFVVVVSGGNAIAPEDEEKLQEVISVLDTIRE